MTQPGSLPRFCHTLGLILFVIGSVGLAVPAAAQDEPKKEISNKVADKLGELQEFIDLEDWPNALRITQEAMGDAIPESYDTMVLSQIQVQILLTQQKYAEAIPPLENALRIGRAYGLMDARRFSEFNQILSQLYFQEATGIKGTSPQDERRKQEYLTKAYQTIKTYLAENDNPSEESLSYAATMIYTQATMDEGKPDRQKLAEAKAIAERGLLRSLKPRESFYVLILAALQQEGNNKEAADLLELLVAQNPTSQQYWNQLQATYLNIANSAPEGSREALEYSIRTILTIDRAQRLGILDTPRDHFNRVGILMNIQQFDEAIRHLVEGLEAGLIEDTQQNWEYLASSYQQVNKDREAINALETASEKFPDQGEIDIRIANIYYLLDDLDEAYDAGRDALNKGNLRDRNKALMFVAYMGFELRRYDEVLPVIQEALDAGAENAEGLHRAITHAIEERRAALEATI